MISTTERRSPSLVSHERCSRRPVTTTRAPFSSDSDTFWARSRQQVTLKKEVLSSHCWLSRFCHRRLTATPKVVTGAPAGVKRSSGSRVRLPTMVTLDDIGSLPPSWQPARGAAAGGLTVGQAHDLVADGLVRESQRPLELVEVAAPHELEDHVVALVLVVDLIGEAASAPAIFAAHRGPPLAEHVGDALDGGVDHLVVELGVDDDHQFIGSHGERSPPFGPGRAGAPRERSRANMDPATVAGLSAFPHIPDDVAGV